VWCKVEGAGCRVYFVGFVFWKEFCRVYFVGFVFWKEFCKVCALQSVFCRDCIQ